MKALIRFCTLFNLDLDVYRKTIDKRKFEEYDKRLGGKGYRYIDSKIDVMMTYYNSNARREKKVIGDTSGVMHYKFGRS